MLNKYIKLLIVSVFVLLVAVQADKSFVLDEVDFPVVSHETSQDLKPEYYRGESSPQHKGIYHPTLYINSLAAFIKIFGFSEVSVRFFGAICVLISAWLLLLILRQLIKKNETAENLFLGLFLLNPYTIANATLPDIDSTVLPIVILLFIYTSIKFLLQKNDIGRNTIIILSILFTLALWSKLTTPLLLPVFLACLAVISTKSYKKSAVLTLKVSVIGAIIFAGTYYIYCLLLNLPPSYTYTFLVESFTKGTSSDGPLIGVLNNLDYFRYFIYWPTLPVVVLFGVSFIGLILNKAKDDKIRVQRLLSIMSIAVLIFYTALIAPFGGFFKYPFPVFGLLILTIVFFYSQQFKNSRLSPYLAVIALAAGFFIEKRFWGDNMFINNKPFNGLLLLVAIIALVYVLIWFMKPRHARNTFVLMALFCIGFQVSISRIQATAQYPTKYLYGQLGIDEATAYLRANTEKGEVVWAMKDVGYYVNNRYHESYSYYFNDNLELRLENMIKEEKVRYYIATTGVGQDNINYYPDIKNILEENLEFDKQFGNFSIYKIREQ